MDCPDGDDEAHCENMACPGHLRCSHTTFCVPPHEICDGEARCPFEDDEEFCMYCPDECNCQGNFVTCNGTNTLNLKYSPSGLILYNSILIALQETSPDLLQNTFYIKLNLGQFHELIGDDVLALNHFKSLRWLQLNNQGIHSLFSHFINGTLLTKLDLSNNNIKFVESQAFGNLKSIEILSLDSNSISYLATHFCESLNRLKFLYLRNNPLQYFPPRILINSHSIHQIRSDWYILCCVMHSVEDCQPRGHLVSSCESLLSFVIAKVSITVQSGFALIINAAILVKFLITKHRSADFPLTVSLVFADFLMGGYLIIITVTDLSTSGSFDIYIAQYGHSLIYVLL